MKCGTSTLHDQLGANDGLFMSEPKEPNFFSDDPVYDRGLGWYEALFEAAAPNQLCGESSTHYSKRATHPKAAERLVDALPEARLLYVVRDPIDRIVSQYIHEWSQREVRSEIDRAVEDFERFADYSCYARQLRPYLEAIGADRVLLVFFERLVAEPGPEFARIGRFLGIESALRWDVTRGAQNASRERMRKSPLRDAIVDAPGLATLRRRFIPQSLRDRVKRFWQLDQRPRLSAEARTRLEAILDPDLAELGRWLGVDGLSCRSFSEAAKHATGDWSDRTRSQFPGRG